MATSEAEDLLTEARMMRSVAVIGAAALLPGEQMQVLGRSRILPGALVG